MQISTIKTAGSENGLTYNLEFPAFENKSVASFYSEMSKRLIKSLKTDRLSRLDRISDIKEPSMRSLVTACKVCYYDGELASVYFDIRHYSDGELILFRRSAHNWRISEKHTEMIAMPQFKKQSFSPDGFYFFDRNRITVFKNLFIPGNGKNLRRSDEEKFIRLQEIAR